MEQASFLMEQEAQPISFLCSSQTDSQVFSAISPVTDSQPTAIKCALVVDSVRTLQWTS